MYDVILYIYVMSYMISLMMSYVMSYGLCRLRELKPTQAAITAGHTTISLASRGLMFICWNLLVLKWFKSSCKMTCARLILQTRHNGSSASIVPHIPLFAGFHQSLQHGLEITMVRSLAYLPCVARNGLQVNWTPSCYTIWSHPTEVLVADWGHSVTVFDAQGYGLHTFKPINRHLFWWWFQ